MGHWGPTATEVKLNKMRSNDTIGDGMCAEQKFPHSILQAYLYIVNKQRVIICFHVALFVIPCLHFLFALFAGRLAVWFSIESGQHVVGPVVVTG